jgi:hypothetical protein
MGEVRVNDVILSCLPPGITHPNDIHMHPSTIQGYYGALGQGDFDARARLTPVPGLEDLPGGIRDAACGWAHAAVATGEGKLWLFGRPHDVRKALSLRHMWQTFPWLVRANQVGMFNVWADVCKTSIYPAIHPLTRTTHINNRR